MKRTVVLVILDGWGLGAENESNPIHKTNPQTFAWLAENFPMTSLQASGISVGLPWGEVGNSEVGHLTLGAGKVIYQNFPKITMAIRDETFFTNKAFKDAFAHAREHNSAVNLVGLLTKGSVHASLDHLGALLEMAKRENISNVKLHLFADSKDSPPHSILELLKKIPREKLATLTGRYYAMNREENWAVTERAYECLTGQNGEVIENLDATIEENYKKNVVEDEFPPYRMATMKDSGAIAENDAVIFFNFREDSIRQISEPFILPAFDKFPVKKFRNLFVATMVQYEERFTVPVAFPADRVEEPLGKVLSDVGKTQLRIAETYKYAHVTYFFNGTVEKPFPNEYRVIIPSATNAPPEEHPELMAPQITDRVIEALQNQAFDFILANYSNPDTIGHTGNYDACLAAVACIDREIGRLARAALDSGAFLVITSDHGNVEQVMNPQTGKVETGHDPNPVPFYLVGAEFQNRKFANWPDIKNEILGIISDVAPTILELMNIQKPPEMTGRSLLGEIR